MNGSGSGTTRQKSAGWFSYSSWMNHPVTKSQKDKKRYVSLIKRDERSAYKKIAIIVSTQGIFDFTICGYTK